MWRVVCFQMMLLSESFYHLNYTSLLKFLFTGVLDDLKIYSFHLHLSGSSFHEI